MNILIKYLWNYDGLINILSIHGRGGVWGGFRLPRNPKYPTQTLPRLGASAKFWPKNVFLKPFWAIFRPASGIFRKVALPRFLELPTFDSVMLQIMSKRGNVIEIFRPLFVIHVRPCKTSLLTFSRCKPAIFRFYRVGSVLYWVIWT